MKFSRLTRSKGRNGIFKTSGLEMTLCVDEHEQKLVVFEPVTSKNKLASCNIEVPKEDVPRLILELQRLL